MATAASNKNHPSAKAPAKTVLNLGNSPPRQKPNEMRAERAQFPRTPTKVNPNQPPWPAYRGYHEYSFAHATMGVRLPTILAKAINDVYETSNQIYEKEKIVDLLDCVHKMEHLKEDLEENRQLRPIIDDGAGDVTLWNKEIAKYFRGKDFMNAPWLFAEAYKYRRLRECFSLSRYWVDYDVFFRQKCDTFARSDSAVFELAMRFAEPTKDSTPEKNKLMFLELAQICSWGNSTDSSLSIDMTEEDIKALQSTGGDHLAATEKNILGNDLHALADYVLSLKGGRIDFILDNAGFESYCDLVFADWLIQAGICKEVKFHGKRIPWFVSDVTKKDWNWLINVMVYGNSFPEASQEEMDSSRQMGRRWQKYSESGVWSYEEHPFWITGYTFWHSPSEAPDSFQHSQGSDLCIYKGDLNHRKLTYDCHAPMDTPFAQAIGPLGSEEGAPPVCSFRTIKSDVVVGIPSGVGEKLDEEEPGWKISGKYAVISLSPGNPGPKNQIPVPA